MEPFQEDIFSESNPVWNKCNEETSVFLNQIVKEVLPSFWNNGYSFFFQTGSIEINSNNFKIASGSSGNSLVLKKWPQDTRVEKIIFHNEVLSFLNARKVSTPKLLDFYNSRGYILYKDNYWTLQSFESGIFYNGNLEVLDELLDQVINLQSSLKDFNFSNGNENVPEINFNYDILVEVRNNLNEIDQYLDEESSNLVKKHWKLIMDEHEQVFKIIGKYQEKSIAHIDLHPYNILINKNRISSFLDFDSVNYINYPVAIAYFSLKTCRQICAKDKVLKPELVGEIFTEGFRKTSFNIEKFSDDFASLANAEVLRRISNIIRFNKYHKNRKWNHVLPVLINHLRESRMLFGNLSTTYVGHNSNRGGGKEP